MAPAPRGPAARGGLTVFPVALRVGDLVITWYGVLVAAGFFAAVRWSMAVARRNGLRVAVIERLAFWCIVAAVAGSRLLYVVTELGYFLEHPLEVFNPRQGGLVFLGGLLGALAASVVVLGREREGLWRYGDVMLPSVALGHALGRVGCFSVGCCYGRAAPGLPWAVRFPESPWTQIAPAGVPLHPVQLYEAAVNLAIFAALTALYRRRRFDGQIALAYLLCYGLARMGLELLRGDELRGFVFREHLGPVLSTSQLTSALMVLAAAVAWPILARRAARSPASGSTGAARDRDGRS